MLSQRLSEPKGSIYLFGFEMMPNRFARPPQPIVQAGKA